MPLYKDELFTCPNCEAIFQSKIVESYDTFGDYYSDLYKASEEDPQSVLHLINVCPKCGFAAFTQDFKVFDVDIEDVRKSISTIEKITEKPANEFNAGDGYLQIADYLTTISIEQRAFIKMQASYAYRILDDKNLNKARELTLETIEQILATKMFMVTSEDMYLYLAGELHRLLGNEDESLKYFKLALEKSDKKSIVSRLTEHQLKTPMEIVPKKLFIKK
ncbi:MAG: DUF2225 domain-containing protein [Candidatus Heimdallarchaeota archaeon]